MKNKWILNFLLIALAFNAVSPLLAMGEQNESFIEDSTSLLKLNPLSAIKNCWNGFVNSASSNFNSITESASNSWLGSGLASVAGHYFQKPETLEGFNKGTALFDAVVGISAIFIIKQYLTLSYIDWKIGQSEKAKAGKKFLFGSWKCNTDGYETYADIKKNPSVKKELLQEVGQSNSHIYILDSAGKRIVSEAVSVRDIQNALNDEKNKLRKDLKKISCFTDAPKKILELVLEKTKKTDKDTYVWYQGAAFKEICIDYFKNLNANKLAKFGEDIEKNCKCDSYIKRALFIPPGWDSLYIHRWRPGVWYKKATKLYWKVYTRFLRTCALLDVLNEKPEISEQSALQNLLDKVNILIEGQCNINNVILGVQLIENLSKAIKILTKLKVDYAQKNNNASIDSIILEVEKHFTNIAIIWKNSKISDNDISIVAGSLSCIKGKLGDLIKLENN